MIPKMMILTVPVLTVDTDGDGVFDQEEEVGCSELTDCDKDGTDDKTIQTIKILMCPFGLLTLTAMGFSIRLKKVGVGATDCDKDGTGDKPILTTKTQTYLFLPLILTVMGF